MTISAVHWDYVEKNGVCIAQDIKTIKENIEKLEALKFQPIFAQGKRSSVVSAHPQSISQETEKFDDISYATPLAKPTYETNQKLKKKDFAGAGFILAQAALDLPNIIDDFCDSVDFASKWIKSRAIDKNYIYMYKKAYDYKKAQHPFSYFRGTLIKDFVNPNSPKCIDKAFANWVNRNDKSLWDTKLGEFIEKKLNIKKIKLKTNIKDINSTPQKPTNIKAYKFITNSKVANYTARSMTRIPVIGLAMSGVVEGCQVVNEVKNGEKAIKSIGKAAVRLTTSTAITAVLGAAGAAALGPLGSFLGITAANFINNRIAIALD